MRRKLILASQSARRKKILTSLGLEYKVIVPVNPETHNKKKPSAIVKDLALGKAMEVKDKIKDGVILAADTFVYAKGEIIGKPKSKKDAKRILKRITSFIHCVYTGIAVIDTYSNKVYVDYEKTPVKMRKMSDEEINDLSKKHLDKAGAYAIQEKDDAMVEYIKGDYYNVVGLPVKKTIKLLKKCGIKLTLHV
ncbi:Maf family protein [bacterium]